ncbi:MAG: hypothetical protein HKN67_07390 [Saprospiraceae bacterium]|nr:hypothetical protein [Saprospiraceae bacterium]
MKKTLLYFLTLVFLFNGCSSDNDNNSSCPQTLNVEIISIENTVCGSSTGSFEVLISSDEYTPEYSIGSVIFQEDGLFTGLTAGTYQLVVKLAEDCQFSNNITIENTDSFQVTTNIQDEDCSNPGSGGIEILTTGTTGVVTYSMNGQTPNTTGVFENLEAGNYQIAVSDESGCEIVTSVMIEQFVNPQLVYDIIGRNCAVSACHGGPQEPNMSKTSEIEALKDRIYERASNRSMPPPESGTMLTDEQIALIECWANQ